MSTFPPITSVFNDGYIAEAYESYRRDPASVDESWRQFFRIAESLAGDRRCGAGAPARRSGAAAQGGRRRGARCEAIRQLRASRRAARSARHAAAGAAELTPEFHGITEADLATSRRRALGFDDGRTAADVVRRAARACTAARIGFEFAHLGDDDGARSGSAARCADGELTQPLSADEKQARAARGSPRSTGSSASSAAPIRATKRFSIEGTDALVPMLDEAIARAAQRGARQVVIGMAHRGRLNVLTHVMGKPYDDAVRRVRGAARRRRAPRARRAT